MFHFFDANPAIGIELSPASVRTVAVAGKASQTRILSASAAQLPANTFSDAYSLPQIYDRAALARALSTVLGPSRTPRRAALCLPDSLFRVQIIEFDELPRNSADRERLIRWRLEKTAAFDVTDTVLRYETLRGADAGLSILACVAKKALIDQYEGVLLECGLEPWSIGPSSFSLLKLYAPYFRKKALACALVHVTDNSFVTIVAADDGARFYRYKEVKRGGQETLSRLVREIEDSLHFYTHRGRSTQAEVGCLLISGEGALRDLLVQQIKSETTLPVEPASPSAVLSSLNGIGPEMAAALAAGQML